jgi:saposin
MLVVRQAQDYIQNTKTTATVKKALEKACSRLPPKLQLQCDDFVETYYDELIKKLLSDFTPQDICVDLKLCTKTDVDNGNIKVGIEKANFIPHIDTNEITDYTVNGKYFNHGKSDDSGECLLCKEVVKGAENKITRGMTKDQIEDILLRECSIFHAYEGICDNFVKKNVDQIFTLLQQQMTADQICQQLTLCTSIEEFKIDEAIIVNIVALPSHPIDENKKKLARVSIIRGDDDDDDDDNDDDDPKKKKKAFGDDPVCVLCEFVMTKLEAELKDKTTQDEIKQAVENICSKMPKSVSKQCSKFVDQYAELIIALIDTVPPKEICTQMGLCTAITKKKISLVGDNECTYGPSHFCSSMEIAEKCKAAKYCEERKLGMFA